MNKVARTHSLRCDYDLFWPLSFIGEEGAKGLILLIAIIQLASCTISFCSTNEDLISADRHLPILLYLNMSINGLKQPGVHSVIQKDREIWLGLNQYNSLNLKEGALVKREFFNEQYALLPSSISAVVNMSDLSLALTVPPEEMSVIVIGNDLKEPSLSPSVTAFYWNYDFSIFHQPILNHAQFLAALKPVLTSTYGSFSNQFMVKLGTINEIVRLETSFLKDFPSRQLRLSIGDAATNTPSFIAPMAIGGLSLTKGALFQTGSLSFPTMVLSGFIQRPANAEIWINDTLQLRKEVPMGGFIFDNINLPAGMKNGELVLKDANGIISIIPFSYYGDGELLKIGQDAFSYALGFTRKHYSSKSFSYGELAFFGNHKIGVNDYWTTSLHSQISPSTILIGAEQKVRLFNRGVLGIATAGTKSQRGFGYLISPQLQVNVFYVNVRARALYASKKYNALPISPNKSDASILQITSGISFDLPYVKQSSFNFLLTKKHRSTESTLGLRQQIPIFNNMIISLNGDYNTRNKNLTFLAFISIPFFNQHRINAETNNINHTLQTMVGVSGAAISHEDYQLTYGVNGGLNKGFFSQGNLNFENNYVRSRLDLLVSKRNFSYLGGAAGSLALIKNHLFLSRPIGRGITLFELPKQKNVDIFENMIKKLGTTDKNGYLLIPDLIPYYTTRLNLDYRDMSIYSITNDPKDGSVITPGFQTAHVVSVNAKTVRYLHFKLLCNKNVLPSGTKIIIETIDAPAYVMNDGSLYLEVPEDIQVIRGHDEQKHCQFNFSLPSKKEDSVVEAIADVVCTSQSR